MNTTADELRRLADELPDAKPLPSFDMVVEERKAPELERALDCAPSTDTRADCRYLLT